MIKKEQVKPMKFSLNFDSLLYLLYAVCFSAIYFAQDKKKFPCGTFVFPNFSVFYFYTNTLNLKSTVINSVYFNKASLVLYYQKRNIWNEDLIKRN